MVVVVIYQCPILVVVVVMVYQVGILMVMVYQERDVVVVVSGVSGSFVTVFFAVEVVITDISFNRGVHKLF